MLHPICQTAFWMLFWIYAMSFEDCLTFSSGDLAFIFQRFLLSPLIHICEVVIMKVAANSTWKETYRLEKLGANFVVFITCIIYLTNEKDESTIIKNEKQWPKTRPTYFLKIFDNTMFDKNPGKIRILTKTIPEKP